VHKAFLLALVSPLAGCNAPPGASSTGADVPIHAPEGGAALEFDLGLDFSFTNNPNGPWKYGYTQGTELAVDQFALDSFGILADPAAEGFWHPNDAGGAYAPVSNPSDGGGGYYPYVAENPSSVSVNYQNAWAVRSQEVAMEPSNGGQYSVVEFVAPQAGACRITAHFEGIHFRLSSTDVHVRLADTDLFSSSIDGYGGDPTFHAVEGPHPAVDYQDTVSVQANQAIVFAVGFGADGTNYNDTTGLFAHITLTPP
jgi:hypothetical protein